MAGLQNLASPTTLAGIVILALLTTVYIALLPPHLRGFLRGKRYKLPPGPFQWPIVGNLPEWLHAKRSQQYKWALEQTKYGEMSTMHMGTRTWVLLNSTRLVNELIAKRTNYTHERPYLPVAAGIVSKDMRPFLKKAEHWRPGRLLVHKSIMGGNIPEEHGKVIEDASIGLLKGYLGQTPENVDELHYRYGNVIMYSIVTGTPLRESTQALRDLQAVTTTFLECINLSLPDFYPQLASWMPRFLQPWRAHWDKVGQFHYDVFKDWWVTLKPLSAPNPDPKAQPTPLQTIVAEFPGNDEEKMYLALALIVAGSDNPRLTFNSGMLAFAHHPAEVQRAREELDGVCGGGPDAKSLRLPSIENLPQLPYMCAMVKEVLRWRPVAALLPPRQLIKDLEFEGYHLPAGTEFYINMMAVATEGYERPLEYHPERWFLDEDEVHKRNRGDTGVDQTLWQFAFAAGKRSCVGWKVAQKELFVTFARMIHCYDIAPAGDFNLAMPEYYPPAARLPIQTTIRSPAHRDLILSQTCDSWVPEKA